VRTLNDVFESNFLSGRQAPTIENSELVTPQALNEPASVLKMPASNWPASWFPASAACIALASKASTI
jgi:hypothetical protein